MTWASQHKESEEAASEAALRYRDGDLASAIALYRRAAVAEELALAELDSTKVRTVGITAVSTASLWYKARDFVRAEMVASHWLATPMLPAFARDELRTLLQYVWTDMAQRGSDVRFLAEDVVFGVRGGEVVYGGAPLELVVEKVTGVRSLYYRTAEMLAQLPLRKHGLPGPDIQQLCRPWLFQTPPGSYQFAIRIQEPEQTTMFPDARPRAAEVARTFLRVLKATASSSPQEALPEIVPDPGYRDAFLRLTRNLAPTGERFGQLIIRAGDAPSSESVVLLPGNREAINDALREGKPRKSKKIERQTRQIVGILRALHLDQDWLEVAEGEQEGPHLRIHKAGDALDDVVGPMVNRRVLVEAIEARSKHYELVDIQLDE